MDEQPGCSKSLKLKRQQVAVDTTVCPKKDLKFEQFNFDTTIEKLELFEEGHCAANTVKNNDWALWTFELWKTVRNIKYTTDQCPSNLFVSKSHEEICKWLCKFITETRKTDGKEYMPHSLYLILAGLQRHMRQLYPAKDINFWQQPVFWPLRNVCDAVFSQLHNKGIGTNTKVAPVFCEREEHKLWNKCIISLDNPAGLLNAVFL